MTKRVKSLDLRAVRCPQALIDCKLQLRELLFGELLEVHIRDAHSLTDIVNYAQGQGFHVHETELSSCEQTRVIIIERP